MWQAASTANDLSLIGHCFTIKAFLLGLHTYKKDSNNKLLNIQKLIVHVNVYKNLLNNNLK